MDVVQYTVLFISKKMFMLSGFVWVHIHRSYLCYLTFVWTCVVVSVFIVAHCVFLSMCHKSYCFVVVMKCVALWLVCLTFVNISV